MKVSSRTAAITVSALLLLFQLLLITGTFAFIARLIYLLSPLFIVWMVYCVLTDTGGKEVELAEGEEWGYRDKDRSELGTF